MLSLWVQSQFKKITETNVLCWPAWFCLQQSIVAYDETHKPTLKKALLLGDAISDLPKASAYYTCSFLPYTSNLISLMQVENYQPLEVIEYGAKPKTEFQSYIRLSRKGNTYSSINNMISQRAFQWAFMLLVQFVALVLSLTLTVPDMLDYSFGDDTCPEEGKLLDHQPLRLNQDDHDRVLQIPVKKVGAWLLLLSVLILPSTTLLNSVFQGANFRDLAGVMVGANNIVEWDPKVDRVYLKSGKPLVRVLLPNPCNDVFMLFHIFCYMMLPLIRQQNQCELHKI